MLVLPQKNVDTSKEKRQSCPKIALALPKNNVVTTLTWCATLERWSPESQQSGTSSGLERLADKNNFLHKKNLTNQVYIYSSIANPN